MCFYNTSLPTSFLGTSWTRSFQCRKAVEEEPRRISRLATLEGYSIDSEWNESVDPKHLVLYEPLAMRFSGWFAIILFQWLSQPSDALSSTFSRRRESPNRPSANKGERGRSASQSRDEDADFFSHLSHCQQSLMNADINQDGQVDSSEFTTFISYEANERHISFSEIPKEWTSLFHETACHPTCCNDRGSPPCSLTTDQPGIALYPVVSRDAFESISAQICDVIKSLMDYSLSSREVERSLETETEPDNGRKISLHTLGNLYRTAAALSIVGTLFVLGNLLFARTLEHEHHSRSMPRILAALQVVNLLTSIVWVLGDWLWPGKDTTISEDDDTISCKAIGVGLHFGFWAATMYLVVLIKAIWLHSEGFSNEQVFQTLERPAHILIFLFATAMALLPLALDLYQPYPWDDSFVCAVAPSRSSNDLNEEIGYYYMFWGFQALFTIIMIIVMLAALTSITKKFISGQTENYESNHHHERDCEAILEAEMELESDSTSDSIGYELGYQLSDDRSKTSSSSEGSSPGYDFKNVPPTLKPWRHAPKKRQTERKYVHSNKSAWREDEVILIQGFGYSVVFVMCCLVPSAFFCISEMLTHSSSRDDAISVQYASWVYMAISLPLNGFLTYISYFLPRMGQKDTTTKYLKNKIPLENLLLALCWPDHYPILKKLKRKRTVLKEVTPCASGARRKTKSYQQRAAIQDHLSNSIDIETNNLHSGDSMQSDYQQKSTLSSGLEMEDYDFQSTTSFGFHPSNHDAEEEEIVFSEADAGDTEQEEEEIVFSRDDEDHARKPLINWDPFEENGTNDDDDFYSYLDRILFGGTDFDRAKSMGRGSKLPGDDPTHNNATHSYHQTRSPLREKQVNKAMADSVISV